MVVISCYASSFSHELCSPLDWAVGGNAIWLEVVAIHLYDLSVLASSPWKELYSRLLGCCQVVGRVQRKAA